MADTPTGQAVQSGDLLACPKCGTVHPCMEELVDELCDVVNQATRMNDGTLDSMAISANASGMRLLARLGKLTIDREYGRRVIAHWPEQANEKLTGGDLLASLAAIYRHSGKFSVRYWRLVPKCHLAATLKAIHDEAGRHMPDAIKQIKANARTQQETGK